MYIEAFDKVTLMKEESIKFVKVNEVIGIIYNSNSGNTKLKWRCIKYKNGKITGKASVNGLVNLFEAKVLDKKLVGNYAEKR
jgi:hypothetical protein